MPLCEVLYKGKTWLACALGVAVCNALLSVRYARLSELLDELCVCKDEEWAKIKKRYVRCDVLIIYDWLLEPMALSSLSRPSTGRPRPSCARSTRRRPARAARWAGHGGRRGRPHRVQVDGDHHRGG